MFSKLPDKTNLILILWHTISLVTGYRKMVSETNQSDKTNLRKALGFGGKKKKKYLRLFWESCKLFQDCYKLAVHPNGTQSQFMNYVTLMKTWQPSPKFDDGNTATKFKDQCVNYPRSCYHNLVPCSFQKKEGEKLEWYIYFF